MMLDTENLLETHKNIEVELISQLIWRSTYNVSLFYDEDGNLLKLSELPKSMSQALMGIVRHSNGEIKGYKMPNKYKALSLLMRCNKLFGILSIDIEEINEIKKILGNELRIMSTPIDFDRLVEDGILKQNGKSYYVKNIPDLPEEVSRRVESFVYTKNGIKVTFTRATKSMKKLAEKYTLMTRANP